MQHLRHAAHWVVYHRRHVDGGGSEVASPWSYLVYRYGAEASEPGSAQIDRALHELFHEEIDGMTEDDYAEHGDAFLRHGYDEGPMYVVEISRTGRATFSQWADQDYYNEIAPAIDITVDEATAREIWHLLARGAIDELKSRFAGGS